MMNNQTIFSLFVDFEDAAVFMIEDPMIDEEEFYENYFIGNEIPLDLVLPEFTLIGGKKYPLRDFMHGRDQAPLVSERAKESLDKIVGNHLEFIPIGTFEKSKYYLLNVLSIINCLDEKESDITYSNDNPDRVLVISNYIFKENVKINTPIFKIPQRLNRIFVTKEFVDCLIDNKLTGVFVENPQEIEISRAKPMFGLPIRK